MEMMEIIILKLKWLLFYYHFQVSRSTVFVRCYTKWNQSFSFFFFPGLGFDMPHYKEMIHFFPSFLGLKDFLNLIRMSWTILSWSYAITWFGNTRMHLKKQEGQIIALPDFLRYSSKSLPFRSSLHDLGCELLQMLVNSHLHLW